MNRFDVLALLSRADRYEDLREIARRSNGNAFYPRAFREALRNQLNRAARRGLISRRFEKWGKNGRGNFGVYVYRIGPRGLARLAWFRASAEGGPPQGIRPGPGTAD